MNVSAIILAAGQSKRMQQPKLLLPWEDTTVLGKVIETIKAGGVEDILVVTGGAREEVEEIISNYKLRVVHNENFEHEEMLGSRHRLRIRSHHNHRASRPPRVRRHATCVQFVQV